MAWQGLAGWRWDGHGSAGPGKDRTGMVQRHSGVSLGAFDFEASVNILEHVKTLKPLPASES